MTKKDYVAKQPRFRVPKSLLYALGSALVVGALLIGGGAVYTYLNEPEEMPEQQPPEDTQYYHEPSMEAEEPDEDARVGVSVQALTSPVEAGSNATFEVRTLRGAECDIEVEYDGERSEDSGLMSRTADRYGMASWTWTVEDSTPEGEWPIETICSWNENSGMVRSEIEVVDDLEAWEEQQDQDSLEE